ncbi:hypothetical protein QR680_009307 [Steinernema hermaphroditum]|uniref:Uncharacterized protein n=1 Tax=Steinernema hermaphroditum TaxID=289476 RepID=A0AA39IJU6_9BILA|nr:hypothetical protein QR680_009307 [Steinernema hermaphroditum]
MISMTGRLSSKKPLLPSPTNTRKTLLPTPSVQQHTSHAAVTRSSKHSPLRDPPRRSDVMSQIAASKTSNPQMSQASVNPAATGKTMVLGDAFALRHVSDSTWG